MIALSSLNTSVEDTHRALTERLAAAAGMEHVPGQPRKAFEAIDVFLAATSRHLNAVESVVLPAARKRIAGGLVRRYVRASKDLERALVSVKAREYGSAYAVSLRWTDIWADVRTRLDAQQRAERELVTALTATLDGDAESRLTDRLERVEPLVASRPHPHVPHLGLLGLLARRALHVVDSFWDATEGRMNPEAAHAPRKKPGPLAQYLLADPRFDEDDD